MINGQGGAAYLTNAAVLGVFRSTLDGNFAETDGGAIFAADSNVIAFYSTISNNDAFESGAIGSFNGTTQLFNTTISGNTSQIYTLAAHGMNEATLINVTFYDNDGMNQEIFADGPIGFQNSLIEGTCVGFNLVSLDGNIESPGNTCGLTGMSDITNVVDPGLKVLADYGGPTLTHLPQPDSIVLDSVLTCSILQVFPDDQRGLPRQVQSTPFGNRCDAGAVEYQGSRAVQTIVIGDGAVSSSPEGIACGAMCLAIFETNSTVHLTANPAPNSVFIDWSGGGCGSGASCTLDMAESHSVTANFGPAFELNVSVQGTGSGSVTSLPAGIDCATQCANDFLVGSTVILTALPATGTNITGWSVASCGNANTCQVSMIDNQMVVVFLDDPNVIFRSGYE